MNFRLIFCEQSPTSAYKSIPTNVLDKLLWKGQFEVNDKTKMAHAIPASSLPPTEPVVLCLHQCCRVLMWLLPLFCFVFWLVMYTQYVHRSSVFSSIIFNYNVEFTVQCLKSVVEVKVAVARPFFVQFSKAFAAENTKVDGNKFSPGVQMCCFSCGQWDPHPLTSGLNLASGVIVE